MYFLMLVCFGIFLGDFGFYGDASSRKAKLLPRTSDKENENPIIWMIIKQLDRLETKMTKLQDKSVDTSKQMIRIHTEVKDIEVKMHKMENGKDTKTKVPVCKESKTEDAVNAQKNEIAGLQNKLLDLKTTLEEISKKHKAMKTNVTRNTDIITALQRAISRLESFIQMSVNKSSIEVLEDKIRKLENTINMRDKTISEMNTKITNFNVLFGRVTKLEEGMIGVNRNLTDINRYIASQKGDKSYLDSKEKTVKCKAGWKLYNHHCYYFVNRQVTWENAKRECERYSSHLVKIDSSEENSWLGSTSGITRGEIWIGANDIAREGKWLWTDNTVLTYSKWNPGEPNNADNRTEDCGTLVTVNGLTWWNDVVCQTTRTAFVCESP